MPAAIAIPAIVGAGASVGSALIGAHASGKAADQQADAAAQAQRFNEQVYRDQQQRMNPFLQLGTDAFTRLYSDHFGVPYSSQLPGAFTPQGPTLGALGGPQMAAAAAEPPSPYLPAGVPQMVTLRAPNGDIEDVPAAVAQQFIAKGARPMGGATGGGMRTLGALGQGL